MLTIQEGRNSRLAYHLRDKLRGDYLRIAIIRSPISRDEGVRGFLSNEGVNYRPTDYIFKGHYTISFVY